MISLTNLRWGSRPVALNLSCNPPGFSWRTNYANESSAQRGYRIYVATAPERAAAGMADTWDSGATWTDRCTDVEYSGPALEANSTYYWSLDAFLADGTTVASGPVEVATEPGEAAWATASWLTKQRSRRIHEDHRPAPYLRKEFSVPDGLRRGRLHVTAAGLYIGFLNGRRIGRDQLAPGWTEYSVRVPYRSYDVTNLLVVGNNCLGFVVGDGWYSGHVGPHFRRSYYGSEPSVRAVLSVTDEHGKSEWVCTEEGWRCSDGPIRVSDLLMGEFYDSRLDLGAWAEPTYDDRDWQPADVVTGPTGRLFAADYDAVHVVDEFPAVATWQTAESSRIFDLGQNFSGHVRLSMPTTPAGAIIRLAHGEIVDPAGHLYVENLRGARAIDTYVADGRDDAEWEPSFTYHGFRYVEVTGTREVLAGIGVVGVAISSVDARNPFTCDSETINKLSTNVVRTLQANYIEVPTDCPQRDERLGWLGDGQVFAPTAMLYADAGAFLEKWLTDIAVAQRSNGAFSDVAPCLYELADGAPGYGDAGVLLPWEMYLRFGDLRLLRRSYPGMRAWLDHVSRSNPDCIWRNAVGNNYGDWLSLETCPKELVATAYFYRSIVTAARIATELDETAEVSHLTALANNVLTSFHRTFCDGNGLLIDRTQSALVLSLGFGLLSGDAAQQALDALVESIDTIGHATTGIMSIAYLMPVLASGGRADIAVTLLERTDFPSWGFQLALGATTFWERWDAIDPHGALQDTEMNSFNHYAFASIGQWLVEGLAGIRPTAEGPGYRQVTFAPELLTDISHSAATIESPQGDISCEWRTTGRDVRLLLRLPGATTGTLVLPPGTKTNEKESIVDRPDVRRFQPQMVAVEVGPGHTAIDATLPARRVAQRAE